MIPLRHARRQIVWALASLAIFPWCMGCRTAAARADSAIGAARASGSTGSANPTDYLRAHYDKREYRIPMRDGVELFTAVYTPKDDSRARVERAGPILIYG